MLGSWNILGRWTSREIKLGGGITRSHGVVEGGKWFN